MTTLPPHDPAFKPPAVMPSRRLPSGMGAMDAASGANGREPVVYDLPSWWRSNDKRRVKFLRQMAMGDGQSPDLREFTVNRVIRPSGAQPMDYHAQAQAILAWVQNNVYYVNEPGEQIQTVSSTLRRGLGDCDDLACLVAAMSHSVALPFRFCLAGVDRKGKPTRWCEGERWPSGLRATHVYLQIGTPALSPNPTWFSAEPTLRGVPLGYDVVLHGIPKGVGGSRTDLSPGQALGGMTEVEQGVQVQQAPKPGVTGWVRENIDWSRVLTGAVEGTITAVAIAWATSRLRVK